MAGEGGREGGGHLSEVECGLVVGGGGVGTHVQQVC